MKISIDDVVVREISDAEIKMFLHNIPSEKCNEEILRRFLWGFESKLQDTANSLHKEWAEKIAERCESVPTCKHAYAELIFSQPDYKNRDQRDAEEAEKEPAF